MDNLLGRLFSSEVCDFVWRLEIVPAVVVRGGR
jgi:hypothetical protein